MTTETIVAAKIFVCHAKEDETIVSTLVELLETALFLRGRDIFCTSLPGHCLPVGARLDEGIEERVKKSKVFLYVVTNNSLRSEWAKDEFKARRTLPERMRAVLPVRVPDVSVDSLPMGLRGLRVPGLNSRAVLHELLDEIAAKLNVSELQPAKMYQEKMDAVLRVSERPSSPPSQRHLLRLFVVGCGVGKTVFMAPIGPNSDSGEFDKFLKLLVDLELSDSSEYRKLVRVAELPASASMIEDFSDALSSIRELIQATRSDREFEWFKMGELLLNHTIRRVRAATSPDSADEMLQNADAMLSAIDTLVDRLAPPKGLSVEISEFLTRARGNADADALLKKANDVVNCAYFVL